VYLLTVQFSQADVIHGHKKTVQQVAMKERCWEVGSTETNKGPDYISQTVISDLFIRPKNIFSGLPSNILRYCEKPQAESANSCMKLMKFQAAQHRLVWHPTMN